MGIGGFGLPSNLGCSASSVNHQFSDLSQPSPGGTGSCGWHSFSPCRAADADVEMIVMPPIGAHLVHPRFARVFLTQRLLDRGVDEDALDLGFFRRGFDDARLALGPMGGIDAEPVGAHHIDGRHLLPVLAGERLIGHWGQPDVGVEPDLVRSVASHHRPAARLGNVAYEDSRPHPFRRRLARKALEEGDHRRMAPEPVARQAHHPPGLAVDRQRLRPRQTSASVKSDRARLDLDRRQFAAENFLRREFWVFGVGERRKRFCIERPGVLRERARGQRGDQHDETSPCEHTNLRIASFRRNCVGKS